MYSKRTRKATQKTFHVVLKEMDEAASPVEDSD
jgi:hypothetical protein